MFQEILPKHCSKMQIELINLFHSSNIPLHFNKTGNKEFTNYQRISLIILFTKSKKSKRDFIRDLHEYRWCSWLGLRRIPSKSVLHNWIKLFDMKLIRRIHKLTIPANVVLTAMDGTGIDSHHISRHYEKRAGFTHLPYAKADLFVDVIGKFILDFNLVCRHQHDIIAAKIFVKRNKLNSKGILADGAFDCEELHKSIRDKGGILYAPIRKINKRSLKQRPNGRY